MKFEGDCPSLDGLQAADEPLCARVRSMLAPSCTTCFAGTPIRREPQSDAFFVECDSETTTQTDTVSGIVNILVGFAPLEPAEFVVIQIQQKAGQSQA